MATTTLRGIIKELKPVEYYNNNTGKKQTFIIFVPGYVNQWGEKLGPDEEWSVDIFNDAIEKHGLNLNCIDKKVEVEVRLRSRTYKRDDGNTGYAISATLKSITFFEAANTNFKDGLPF